jgi:prepilin signal peptidase PulO-like enzyme (type II secretory pathway)
MAGALVLHTVLWIVAGPPPDPSTDAPRRGPTIVVTSATAVAWTLLWWRFGVGWRWCVEAAAASALIALAACDARCHRLPKSWCHRAAVLVVVLMTCAASWTGRWDPLAASLSVATLDWVAFSLVWRMSRHRRFGRGDVRLAWLVGASAAWAGPPRSAVLFGGVALLGGCLGGVVVGVGSAFRRGSPPSGVMVPLGPPLAVATLATVVFGPVLLGRAGSG